ncbi:hypothetical protein [Sulfitobacter pacificus]|uniref:hypothetical protein n=1 Tax=Sulfitobacter pacificus TaxID=1499314 RepID=UPI003101DC93
MVGGLDAHSAQYQTREMQRDAYLKVGVFTYFASGTVAWITLKYYEISVHFVFILLGSALFGFLVGHLTKRHGLKISAALQEEDRAARKAYKDAKLKEFMDNKADSAAENIKNTRQGAEKED